MRNIKLFKYILLFIFIKEHLDCSGQLNRIALEVLCKQSQLIASGSIIEISCATNQPGVFDCLYIFAIDSVYKGKPRWSNVPELKEISITRIVPCSTKEFFRKNKPKAIGCWEEFKKEDKLILFLNDTKRGAFNNKTLMYEATDEFIFGIKPTQHLEYIIKKLVIK